MSGGSGAAAFALSYGALERTIAGINATDPEAIRIRFRKLRLRPFPRDIRTGTGVRVRYDLSRSIALATVFELNSLWLPQGSAVSIVERAWPEICRAAICAAADLGLVKLPPATPSGAGPIVTFMPDGFAPPNAADVVAARVGDRMASTGSGLRLDIGRQISALASAVDTGDPGAAFAELGTKFGWTRPHDTVASGRPAGDFLDDGPYFDRAEALLGLARDTDADADADADAAANVAPSDRMQAIVDYLANPAPVDVWKANLGTAADRPRLGHLLMAFAKLRGFDATAFDFVEAAVGPDELGAAAAEIIRRARARRP